LEAEIQGLLNPALTNVGYFLPWFQPLQLPSTQSESPLALIPLAPKSHVLNCEHISSLFIFQSGLTVTGLARVSCTQLFGSRLSAKKTTTKRSEKDKERIRCRNTEGNCFRPCRTGTSTSRLPFLGCDSALFSINHLCFRGTPSGQRTEAIGSPETSVSIHEAVWCFIPEDCCLDILAKIPDLRLKLYRRRRR
jgi:hypothetical protein